MLPRPARHFKASVTYFFFSRAARKLEAPQTFIFFVGPAEMQCFGTPFGHIFYSFRHGEAIGAKLLQSFIRRSTFIDRVSPQLTKHGGGDGGLLTFEENNT